MAECKVTANERLCKQPSEKRRYSMDFSNLMGVSETINSITSVSQEYLDGSTSTDLTFSGQAIEGQTVTVWIEGGVDRKRYHVVFLIQTSTGAILEGEGPLVVRER